MSRRSSGLECVREGVALGLVQGCFGVGVVVCLCLVCVVLICVSPGRYGIFCVSRTGAEMTGDACLRAPCIIPISPREIYHILYYASLYTERDITYYTVPISTERGVSYTIINDTLLSYLSIKRCTPTYYMSKTTCYTSKRDLLYE